MRTRPDLAEVLQQSFHFDTRSQPSDGVRAQAVPIFSYHSGKLNVLYKRRFIDTAQRFPEVPRPTPQRPFPSRASPDIAVSWHIATDETRSQPVFSDSLASGTRPQSSRGSRG